MARFRLDDRLVRLWAQRGWLLRTECLPDLSPADIFEVFVPEDKRELVLKAYHLFYGNFHPFNPPTLPRSCSYDRPDLKISRNDQQTPGVTRWRNYYIEYLDFCDQASIVQFTLAQLSALKLHDADVAFLVPMATEQLSLGEPRRFTSFSKLSPTLRGALKETNTILTAWKLMGVFDQDRPYPTRMAWELPWSLLPKASVVREWIDRDTLIMRTDIV